MLSNHQDVATKKQLLLHVNEELVLDGGTVEQVEGSRGRELRILPPETTLFHQVLKYLQAKPDPPTHPSPPRTGPTGVAAAALILRWGSYLAVLLDPDKPMWPEVNTPGTSRISNSEIARINIETSAGLAEWIDLSRSDPGLYVQLVQRALHFLPVPSVRGGPELRRLVEHDLKPLLVLATPTPAIERELMGAGSPEFLRRVFANARAHPSRLFANTLVNIAWRNGPVENIHAGKHCGYPLDQRRITSQEERNLMEFSSERLSLGLELVEQLSGQPGGVSWPEQVLPFGLARFAPTNWTLTERSREVRLPA
jgi:hypothetical protein